MLSEGAKELFEKAENTAKAELWKSRTCKVFKDKISENTSV